MTLKIKMILSLTQMLTLQLSVCHLGIYHGLSNVLIVSHTSFKSLKS